MSGNHYRNLTASEKFQADNRYRGKVKLSATPLQKWATTRYQILLQASLEAEARRIEKSLNKKERNNE